MVSWVSSGGVLGYGRVVGAGVFATRSGFSSVTYKLASPGSVDLNGTTRIQLLDPTGFSAFQGQSTFDFTLADVNANPGKYLTATGFVAPASAFAAGVVPTPSQIIAASTSVHRATSGGGGPNGLLAPGQFTAVFYGYEGPHVANTKFWYLHTPTAVTNLASPPNIANDTPVGDVNTIGRAVSLWTNRTPLAPVITEPVGETTAFAGSEVTFAFSPRGADRVASFPGDLAQTDFDDVAGVQVQYAPQATLAQPSPTWIDLPIANTAGSALGRGWYMDLSATAPANDGAKNLWRTYRMKIRYGSSVLSPSAGSLPSGDWQLRVRTFDYGHARLDSDNGNVFIDHGPPLLDATYSYTPDNYPANNTSPWSEPVLISVSDQVPKPLPMNPTNSIAIIDGLPVTLTWQYRNTYDPPYAQATRSVQIRVVGDALWTSLVTAQASASPSYPVSGFTFVSGNQYEWRVQVTDTSGAISDYSDSAFFWVVPPENTGDFIAPGDLIDGATLGCGTHRVVIYRRGGLDRIGEIRNLSSVEWNRVRDDISIARIVVSGWDVDCGNLLAQLQPWAYEVVIFRDNGYTTDRVWEGPISLLTYESDKVVIQAKDVMNYAYRRIIKQAMIDGGRSPTAGSTVVARAARIIQNAFAPDDPNVLSHLRVLTRIDDATQYRSTPAYSRTAFEEIDDMAANAGLDYTAVGRAILVWGTKHRIGTLPEFQDHDLGSSPIVSVYGMSTANRYVVSDGNGVYGEATRLDADGKDETYGLIEMLSSTWASETAEETGTYTEAGLQTMRDSFAEAAERSIASRYPPPLVVRVPDNTRVNPDTVISIQHLVPGVVVPLRSTGTLRSIIATQKLDAVKVIETGGEEIITITLSPYSRDDIGGGVEVE